MYVFKTPTNAVGFKDVILLHNYYRHVSATRVAIFRMVRRRIQIQLQLGEITLKLKVIRFLVKIHSLNIKSSDSIKYYRWSEMLLSGVQL